MIQFAYLLIYWLQIATIEYFPVESLINKCEKRENQHANIRQLL